jgi:hypothetical protein
MGYGEVVGNESIHWIVGHEDEKGAPVALSSKPGRGRHPKTGHDVHVDETARGCDPMPLNTVGHRKGHPGRYRVKLRFQREQDAKAAVAAMQQTVESGMHVLVLDVPVVHRREPDDAPPPEIRIDW